MAPDDCELRLTTTRRWRPATGVAWVDGENDGVALVDVNSSQQHAHLIRAPYAQLWLAVGAPDGAAPEDLAHIVGTEDAHEIAANFLEKLHQAGLIEPIPAPDARHPTSGR